MIPLGTGAWWPHRTHLLPTGCSHLKDPQPEELILSSGASACPPAQPHLRWPQHSGRATPVTSAFVSKQISWDTAWTICVPRARGASPQHLPPMGRGEAQAALWI